MMESYSTTNEKTTTTSNLPDNTILRLEFKLNNVTFNALLLFDIK